MTNKNLSKLFTYGSGANVTTFYGHVTDEAGSETKINGGTLILSGPQSWGPGSMLRIGSGGGGGSEPLGSEGPQGVPEPATLVMLVVGGLLMLARTWLRRRTP